MRFHYEKCFVLGRKVQSPSRVWIKEGGSALFRQRYIVFLLKGYFFKNLINFFFKFILNLFTFSFNILKNRVLSVFCMWPPLHQSKVILLRFFVKVYVKVKI